MWYLLLSGSIVHLRIDMIFMLLSVLNRRGKPGWRGTLELSMPRVGQLRDWDLLGIGTLRRRRTLVCSRSIRLWRGRDRWFSKKKDVWVRRTPGLRVLRLGQSRMGDLLGGKKRVLVPVDHWFQLIFCCNFKRNDIDVQSVSWKDNLKSLIGSLFNCSTLWAFIKFLFSVH